MAKDSVVKRFHTEDGSLLSENPPPPLQTGELAALTAEALLAQEACDAMDSLPFDAEYESDTEDLAAMLLEDYGSDDDDSAVGITRATI
jgi:hypothetical protein